MSQKTKKRKVRPQYQNFILITYENKGYDKKSYPKLILNKLKVTEGPTFIYIPLGT